MKSLALLLLLNTALACEITPELWSLTQVAALEHDLEPELLAALVWQESRFCNDAVSPKGALGLGQLMPGTALSLGVNPFDVEENLRGAARYLNEQLITFGSLELALAAYNAGPEAVRVHQGIPPFEETQGYVPSVLATYEAFKEQTLTTPVVTTAEAETPSEVLEVGYVPTSLRPFTTPARVTLIFK
jgi:soluble lytic murein transglycosylase-like protein